MAFTLSVLAAKTTIVVLYLFFLYRILGKRSLGQFNLYDFATLMAVANAVQNSMTMGKGDLAVGFVSAGTLITLGWILTRVMRRSNVAHRIMFGTPTILVSDGCVFEDRMQSEKITEEELNAALRRHGILESTKVRLAVLELDGSISVVPQEQR